MNDLTYWNTWLQSLLIVIVKGIILQVFLLGLCVYTVQVSMTLKYQYISAQWVNWVGSNTIVASSTTINWDNTRPTISTGLLPQTDLSHSDRKLYLRSLYLFQILFLKIQNVMDVFKNIYWASHKNAFLAYLLVLNHGRLRGF